MSFGVFSGVTFPPSGALRPKAPPARGVPSLPLPSRPRAAPLPPSPRRSALEESLWYLLRLDDRLSPAVVGGEVRAVTDELRRRRSARRAVRLSPRPPPPAHVSALVDACLSASNAAALAALRRPARASGFGRALLAAALADALLDAHSPNALALLDEAVAGGHVGAMLRVGRLLRDGVGVAPDLDAAVRWVERAADAGYAPALFELGVMYEDGAAVGGRALDADWGEAMRCFRRAAEKGHAEAQLRLGKLLWKAAAEAEEAVKRNALDVDKGKIAEFRQRAQEYLELAATSGNSEEAMRLLRHISSS